METIPSRKASPLRIANTADAVQECPQTAPEKPHRYPSSPEISLKTSNIVKMGGLEPSHAALPYFLTVEGLLALQTKASEPLTPG